MSRRPQPRNWTAVHAHFRKAGPHRRDTTTERRREDATEVADSLAELDALVADSQPEAPSGARCNLNHTPESSTPSATPPTLILSVARLLRTSQRSGPTPA